MSLYIAVNSDGTQQRVDTAPLDLHEGETLVVDARFDAEPDPAAFTWNPASRSYEATVPVVYARTQISKREFLQRLNAVGALDQIEYALMTTPTTPEQTEMLKDLRKLDRFLTASEFVDLTLPLVTGGVASLRAINFITSDADAAFVLAPSTVAQE